MLSLTLAPILIISNKFYIVENDFIATDISRLNY